MKASIISAHEYGRGIVHTNTVEGFYSVFKRGMKGTYQHCHEKHLHCYLSEFDFIRVLFQSLKARYRRMSSAQKKQLVARQANGSIIKNLVKPRPFKQKARALFIRWRKERTAYKWISEQSSSVMPLKSDLAAPLQPSAATPILLRPDKLLSLGYNQRHNLKRLIG